MRIVCVHTGPSLSFILFILLRVPNMALFELKGFGFSRRPWRCCWEIGLALYAYVPSPTQATFVARQASLFPGSLHATLVPGWKTMTANCCFFTTIVLAVAWWLLPKPTSVAMVLNYRWLNRPRVLVTSLFILLHCRSVVAGYCISDSWAETQWFPILRQSGQQTVTSSVPRSIAVLVKSSTITLCPECSSLFSNYCDICCAKTASTLFS